MRISAPCARRALVTLTTIAVVAIGASAVAASAKTSPTVTIGVIAPVDGGLTDFGRGIRNSVLLAVGQANARSAVKGWTIRVRVLDDSSDATKGKAAAKTLAADPKVVAVVGPYNSGVALEAAPVLAAKQLALVSPANTLTSLTVGDNVKHPRRQWKTYFRLVGPDSRQAEFLAASAQQLGFKTAAVVSETKAVSKGLADEFATAFEHAGGSVPVRKVVPDQASAGDFTDFVTAATAAHPDVVFFGGEYMVAATLRTTATNAGLVAPVMGGDGMNDPAYITDAGDAARGSYASGVGVPLAEQPGATEFLPAYQAAGYTSAPSDYGPYAYDAANAVIASLTRELPGRSSLPKSIRTTMVRDLQRTKRTGVTGAVRFDRYGDAVAPTFTLYKVDGTPATWVAQGSK